MKGPETGKLQRRSAGHVVAPRTSRIPKTARPGSGLLIASKLIIPRWFEASNEKKHI